MTLKQEFIDIITTIMDAHILQDSDKECPFGYTLDVDSEIVLLPEHEYADASEWDPETRGEMLRIPVDIELYVNEIMDVSSDYICFRKKPDRPELKDKIIYINTRKQMMEYIKSFILNLEQTTQDYKNYAEKIIELQDYVVEFVEQVKKDFPVFSDIDSSSIPITFRHDYRKDGDATLYNIAGDCYISRSTFCIRIFDCWTDLEKLKATVRHELLHYMLFLKGVGYSDDSPIFWYFADRYDADPYETMSEENQRLYNFYKMAPAVVMNAWVYIYSVDVHYTATQNEEISVLREKFCKALKELDASALSETIAMICNGSADLSVATSMTA